MDFPFMKVGEIRRKSFEFFEAFTTYFALGDVLTRTGRGAGRKFLVREEKKFFVR
jgi:hypothetical protein